MSVHILNSLNEYANRISKYDNDLHYLSQCLYTWVTASKSIFEKAQKNINAMNINMTEKEYASVDSAEHQKWIKKNCCFKCDFKNHISSNCSVLILCFWIQTEFSNQGRFVDKHFSHKFEIWSLHSDTPQFTHSFCLFCSFCTLCSAHQLKNKSQD